MIVEPSVGGARAMATAGKRSHINCDWIEENCMIGNLRRFTSTGKDVGANHARDGPGCYL